MKILCDLHIHSALSPCALEEMSPNNIVNMALLQELTAIAVTDHNSCRNAGAVMEAAMGTGLVVVPGMEVQTKEEVHMVTLFQNLEDALAMQEEVYGALPDMKAPAKIRSKQMILDGEDEIIGFEERLLGFSCSMSLEQVVERTAMHHGLAIPAHIDRKSCSILSNLGFIPEHLHFPVLELSMYADRPHFEGKYSNQRLISASDAHELGFVGMAPSEIEVETVSAHGILKALSQGLL